MPEARLGEITRLFFRVGTTVFGGGNTAIAVLQREFDRREWLSPEKFALSFGLARLTPVSIKQSNSIAIDSAKARRVNMPCGVMQNRLAKVDAQFGELLDKRHERDVIDAVDAAHEFQIVKSGQM